MAACHNNVQFLGCAIAGAEAVRSVHSVRQHQGVFWWTSFFSSFLLKTPTSNRRRLLYHRRRFSNHRWIPSDRWLPFNCRPIVCLNTDLAIGRPKVLKFNQKAPGAAHVCGVG